MPRSGPQTSVSINHRTSYLGAVAVDLDDLTPAEDAVAQTLLGWGAELDVGEKFWWHDWNRMTRDVIEAMRTGVPLLYDDEKEAGTAAPADR